MKKILKKITHNKKLLIIASLLIVIVLTGSVYGLVQLAKTKSKTLVIAPVTVKSTVKKATVPVAQTPTPSITSTPITPAPTAVATPKASPAPAPNCSTLNNEAASIMSSEYAGVGSSVNTFITNDETQDEQTALQLTGSSTLSPSILNQILEGANNLINTENNSNFTNFYEGYVGTQNYAGCPITVQMEDYPALTALP